MKTKIKHFMNGTAEYIILSCLRNRPYYAFEIIKLIENNFDDNTTISRDTIYTSIYSLEQKGYIKSNETYNGKRKRVYYILQPKGEAKQKELKEEYNRITQGISLIINAQ